jgi:hypothetical protein
MAILKALSSIQIAYCGKFSVQSDGWNYFYRTRKVDGGFFGLKIISKNFFSFPKKYPFDLKI